MILVLFAILSAVGAWHTWRHNPLYSARSTLRSAAVVLLAVAAMICIVVAAVNLTINRPQPLWAAPWRRSSFLARSR